MQLDLQLLNMIKGFCIGLCSSAPIGPIAVYVIQQSLSKGHKAGFITGLGATIVDTVFACISIFALAYAQEHAPVKTGAYRDGLQIKTVEHAHRTTYLVVGTAPHTMLVEAQTGNLRKALKAGKVS